MRRGFFFDLGRADRGLQSARHFRGDEVLQVEHLFDPAVIAFGPDVIAVLGLDQLNGNADPWSRDLHAAFKRIGHAQFTPDLRHRDRASAIGIGRVACDDKETADAAEHGGDRLDEA